MSDDAERLAEAETLDDPMMAQLTPEAQAWIKERAKPGNWIDIAPGEEFHPDIKGWNITILHMMRDAFVPEIRERLEAGTLPDDFFLFAAQLIQPREGGRIIRLNGEVRGRPYLRANRDFQEGEGLKLEDFEDMEYFDLAEEELDSGHFTLFFTGTGWWISFDLRPGRQKSMALLEKALAFLAATRWSTAKDLAEPAIDTLYTACENIAKARLILDHQKADEFTSHKATATQINLLARMGNISVAFKNIFNRLAKERNPAKYSTGMSFELPSWEDIDVCETFARELLDSVKPKRPEKEPSTD
jgi:hypothetical protein